MLVTNQTTSDIYFGPLHLAAGVGEQLTVDDTSATSLYLLNDGVADALNNAYNSGRITVTGASDPFPRPTGDPTLFHGSGDPEGLVFAPQGSVYMRRDGVQTNGGVLYMKTTGVTFNTGWLDLATASGATAVLPPGIISPFGGASAPTGWLLCDGSAVSRTLYSLLFSAIGTAYGSGDGTTTFNVPDMRGRFPAGYAATGGNSDVSSLGNGEGISVAARRPKHRHSVNDPGHTHATPGNTYNYQNEGNNYTYYQTPGGDDVGAPSSGGGGSSGITVGASSTDSLDAPAYLVVNYIVKT